MYPQLRREQPTTAEDEERPQHLDEFFYVLFSLILALKEHA